MEDYLRPVGKTGKRFAFILCLVVTFVASASAVLVLALMIEGGRFQFEGKPIWVGAVVLAVIALSCGWIAVRLWNGSTSNGATLLPVWFIEGFGALFLTALLWLGLSGRWPPGSLGALGVALTMLLIRWQVRRKVSGEA